MKRFLNWWRERFGSGSTDADDLAKASVVNDLLGEVGSLGERIWRWLEPPKEVLSQLDKDFKLACAGAEAAARGQLYKELPPLEKVQLVARYATWAYGVRNLHAKQMARAGAILGKLAPLPYTGDNQIASLRSGVVIEEAKVLQNLRTRFSEASEADAQYNLFRFTHKLGRAPQMPESPWLWTLVLVAIVLLEGALSALAFAYAGSFEGLLNAIAGGFLISLATVALGVVTGFIGLRYLGYSVREQPIVERFWKVGGAAIAIGSLLLVLLMVLEVAVTRAKDVATSLSQGGDPAVPPLVFALAFVGLSLFSYFFAVLKSFEEFSDPFPGFGKAFKLREEARSRYEDEKREFLKAVSKSHADALQRLIGELRGEADQIKEMRALKEETTAVDSSLRQIFPAGWQRILAPFSAFDDGFANVTQDRREGVAAPDRPEDPEFQDIPDFEGGLQIAQSTFAANKTRHEQVVKEFADELAQRLKALFDLIEDWDRDFRNRSRPFGQPPEQAR